MPLLGIDASRAVRGQKTGVEWYSFEIIRALLQSVPDDWDIRLYADRQIQNSKFKIHRLVWPPKYLWTQVRLPLETLLHPPNVLFIPGHVHPFIHPRRTVIMIHDVAFMTHPEAYSPHGRAYLRLTTAWAARTAKRIIVPTRAVQDDLVRFFPSARSRVRVIPHGPGIVVAPKIQNSIFKIQPYFIFVGRLETKKNTPRLVRAFLRARESSAAVRSMQLALVGRPGRGVEDIPHHESVIRTGHLSLEEMTKTLASARALLFPSLAEGFGLPILDAMSLGVSVLTSRGGATEEVSGGAALLVDPTDEQAIADTIVQLAENDVLCHDLSIRGRRRATEFSWEIAARATWNVIQEARAT